MFRTNVAPIVNIIRKNVFKNDVLRDMIALYIIYIMDHVCSSWWRQKVVTLLTCTLMILLPKCRNTLFGVILAIASTIASWFYGSIRGSLVLAHASITFLPQFVWIVMRYARFQEADERIFVDVVPVGISLTCYASNTVLLMFWRSIMKIAWLILTNTLLWIVLGAFGYLVRRYRYMIPTTVAKKTSGFIIYTLVQIWKALRYLVTLPTLVLSYIDKRSSTLVAHQITSGRELYVYKKLLEGQIRLLKISRRLPLMPLRCQLIPFDLSSPPPFEAISYCWGTSTSKTKNPTAGTLTQSIIIDNRDFKASENVHSFLNFRRSWMEDVYVWVDAVCINQHDVKEKNSQVKRMKDIYSRSSRVLIWLRNAGNVSSARSLMMMLIHQRRSGMDEEAIKWDCMRRDPDFSWHDLAVLFTNVWFSRTWIIQEVACAPKAYIATDTALMEWDHLAEAVEILMSPHLARFMDIATVLGVNTEETFAGIARTFQISSLRHRRQRNDSISVAELLRFGLEFDATDRRDKVFALLGLTTQDLPKDLDPDYEKTEQQVYTEAMHFVLGRSCSDFHLLNSIGSESRDRVENIPSWVPDFSSGLRAHYGMASSLLYRAGMKCHAQIEPVPESGSNYIQIAGCRADEITHLGGSSLQLSLQGLKPGGDQQAVLASFTSNVRM